MDDLSRRFWLGTILALGLVMLSGCATGIQSTRHVNQVHTALSPDEVNLVLERTEAQYVQDVVEDMPVWFVNDQGMTLFLIGHPGETGIESLQLFAYVESPSALKYELINEWNRSKRYAHAYVDADGDASLGSDLDIAGGISLESVERFIRRFVAAVRMFEEHLAGAGV